MISFTVRGIPAPQGSKRAFRNKYSGRIQQVESSKRVAPWRSDVRDAAIDAMTEDRDGMGWPGNPLAGPIAVKLTFSLPRPRGHYGTGRNAAVLKPSAPTWPTSKPDLDKLVRAVLDACSALVWRDDAQVVGVQTEKLYASDHRPPGVEVQVTDLTALDEAMARFQHEEQRALYVDGWFGQPLVPPIAHPQED